MSTSNSTTSSSILLPAVVESTVSSVLDDAPLQWQVAGRRPDGKQSALTAEQKAINAKITAAKAAAQSGRKSQPKAASGANRKPHQQPKTPRFCRFEDHQYDREEKAWVPMNNGTLRMCPDKDCTFSHRAPRPGPCPIGDSCSDNECTLLHSKQRPKPCRFGENCINEKCVFNHPSTRKQPCPNGANCYVHAYEQQRGEDDEPIEDCPHGHPRRMARVCQHNQSCRRFECNFLHAPDAPRDCPDGSQCQWQWQVNGAISRDQVCSNKHPRHTRVVEDSNGNFRFM